MSKQTPDPGADYRAAKQAVAEHVAAWAAAEQARHRWLRSRRGVPPHVLYDRHTGAPLDPELAALEEAEAKARADVDWCRALVIACGEVVKGRSFAEVLATQQPKPPQGEVVDLIERGGS